MKIVIDARFFGTETGIGRYVKELVENLERIDFENQYVIFLSAKNFDLYQPKNDNFQKKLADIKWYSLAEQISFRKMVDDEKADLAHFPHFNVPFFCRTPYVVTIHDLILRHYPTSAASTKNPIVFYLKYLAYNFILKMAIRRAKKIIVPSYFVRNDILSVIPDARRAYSGIQGNNDWIPDQVRDDTGGVMRDDKREKLADKTRVIYEGLSNFPQTDMGAEYLKTKNIVSPYLLYIGNCYPHKNLEKLVEAFKKISPSSILPLDPPSASPLPPDYRGKKGEEGGGLQLVLVGKRDYFSKRLEKFLLLTTHYSLQTSVIFYGFASDEELSTLYKHASLYVFPSLMEGFGLPPLEALSFGLPSAVSDIPVFHEVLGGAAFYFNPNNTDDIARVIKTALQNTEARGKILEEGKIVLSRYSSARHAQETMEVYHAAYGSMQRG